MNWRALLPSITIFLLSAVGVTGCVWPEPGPGDPVPAIEASASWSASADTVTITVQVSDLDPTTVRLFPRGLQGEGLEIDKVPPFSFTLEASAFAPGAHKMWIIADDGSTYVGDEAVVNISGCNGYHYLCNRGYDEVRYVTTHNAMSSAADGWTGPNQNLDVPAQLAAGVRALMLDTYRAGSVSFVGTIQVPDADPDSAYLCHSLCSIGKQDLAQGLTEIREFLDQNPGAVITLIIESYLSHALTAEAFAAAGLTPYAYQHPGGTWPTLGEMIDANRRLVVLQDRTVDPAYPWLMYVWEHAFETHFSNSQPSDFSCTDNRGSPGAALFILNHFLTDLFGSPELSEQVNYNPLLLERILECEVFQGAMANFVTVDFVDIGDTLSTVESLNEAGGF